VDPAQVVQQVAGPRGIVPRGRDRFRRPTPRRDERGQRVGVAAEALPDEPVAVHREVQDLAQPRVAEVDVPGMAVEDPDEDPARVPRRGRDPGGRQRPQRAELHGAVRPGALELLLDAQRQVAAATTWAAATSAAPSTAARSPAARTRPPSSRRRRVRRPGPARRPASAIDRAHRVGGEVRDAAVPPDLLGHEAGERRLGLGRARRRVRGEQLEAEAAQAGAQRGMQVVQLLRIAGDDEHRVAGHGLREHHGAARAAVTPGDRQLALLQRGEQALLALQAERRDLVHEEDAAVRPVHGAGGDQLVRLGLEAARLERVVADVPEQAAGLRARGVDERARVWPPRSMSTRSPTATRAASRRRRRSTRIATAAAAPSRPYGETMTARSTPMSSAQAARHPMR
jgi:hypothetical protein